MVVTRNVAERIRGFLASCMSELAPGVYTSPKMSQAVRDRVWAVLEDWFQGKVDEAIVMTWPDARSPGGQALATLGVPRHEFHEIDDFPLVRRPLTAETERMLEGLARASAPREPG